MMLGRKSAFILFAFVLIAVVVLTQLMDRTIPRVKSIDSGDGANVPVNPDVSLQADAAKKLKVLVSMSPEEFFALQKMNQLYEKQHPGTTVVLENITDEDVYWRMKQAAKTGAADIFLLANAWVCDFASLGLLAPEPEAMAVGNADNRPFEQLKSQVKWNAISWGVPKEAELYALIVSKQALADKEISQPPANSAQLVEMNRQFGEADGQFAGIYVDPADPYAFLTLAWYMGLPFTDTDQDKATTGDVLSLQNQFAGLYFPVDQTGNIQADMLPNYYTQSSEFDPWVRLASGEIPFMIAGASDFLRHYADSAAIKFLAVTKFGSTYGAPVLTGKSYSVSAFAADTSAAFSWIGAAVSAEYELVALQEAHILPALPSVYGENSDLYSGLLPRLRQALANGVPLAADPSLPARLDDTAQAAYAFYAGKQSWQELGRQLGKLWGGQADMEKVNVN